MSTPHVKGTKDYLCKKCGDSNIANFIVGRYSTCRKCRTVKAKENKLTTSDSIKVDSEDKNIEKYLRFDYSIFNGYSTKQIIDLLYEEIQELKKEVKFYKERSDQFENKLDNIQLELNKVNIDKSKC